MRKLLCINILSIALFIPSGITYVSAEPLTNLNAHSSINQIDSEDNIRSNNRNFQLAQNAISIDKQPIGWSQRDFAVPDFPAGQLIGSSTSKIPNISTPGALATNLLNGLNADGKFATGISIDTVPYLLFRGYGMTLEEYQKGGLKQFLSNTSLSIATNKETSSDTARVGIAAQFVLLNEGDRRMDGTLLKKLQDFAATLTGDPDFPKWIKENKLDQKIGEKLKEFKASKEYKDEINRLENQPIWTAAVGTSFISPTGRYSDLRGDGMGAWTTYRQGIGGNSQLIVHGSYRSGERIKDPNGDFFNGDTILLGTRLRMGDEASSKFSLETAYNIENRQGTSSNSYFSFGVGLEQKIVPQENIWLILSVTADPGRKNGGDFRFNSSFKWEFGPQGNI